MERSCNNHVTRLSSTLRNVAYSSASMLRVQMSHNSNIASMKASPDMQPSPRESAAHSSSAACVAKRCDARGVTVSAYGDGFGVTISARRFRRDGFESVAVSV